ncbi:MAG TPA: nucleotidyltransferase family protein [Gammaproteobacteria bacterium]
MKAMILAAGRGERMRPLTDTTPKPLLEVRGKPLIQWHIERLRDAGFNELVVNVSWLKEKLVEFLGDGSRFGANIIISEESPEPLETAGGIIQALPQLGDRFAVVNGDVFTGFDFRALRDFPMREDLAHLVLVPNPEHHARGDFGLEQDRVIENAAESFTFSGIGIYRRELFENLDPGVRKLAPLLREAMRVDHVSGALHEGQWSDVGTFERLAALNQG